MGRLLVLFFLVVFLSSCGDDSPKGVLPKETMVPLLTDLHLADAYAPLLYGDTVTAKSAAVYKALFKKYDTDSVTIRKSLSYYAERPEELTLMYQQVEKNLVQLEKQEQKRLLLERKAALRKAKIEEAAELRKAKIADFRLRMSKGEYDFSLSSYLNKAKPYFRNWREYRSGDNTSAKNDTAVKKINSLKTDSLKKDLLKKEQRR